MIYRTRKAETTVSSIMLAASSGKRLCNGTVSVRPSARLSVPSTASDSDVHLVCRSSGAGSRCRSVAPGTDRYLGSRRPSCSVRESVCNNSKQNVKSHVFWFRGKSLKCKKERPYSLRGHLITPVFNTRLPKVSSGKSPTSNSVLCIMLAS